MYMYLGGKGEGEVSLVVTGRKGGQTPKRVGWLYAGSIVHLTTRLIIIIIARTRSNGPNSSSRNEVTGREVLVVEGMKQRELMSFIPDVKKK